MMKHIEDNRTQCRALGQDTPGVVKPCVLEIIQQGISWKGQRWEAGLAIVFEMKRLGVKKATIAGILAAWNLRNAPPLFRDELSALIGEAYADQEYELDCDLLSEFAPGVCESRRGKRSCMCIDLLLELEMRQAKRSRKKKKRKPQEYRGQNEKPKQKKNNGPASKQRVLFPHSW